MNLMNYVKQQHNKNAAGGMAMVMITKLRQNCVYASKTTMHHKEQNVCNLELSNLQH